MAESDDLRRENAVPRRPVATAHAAFLGIDTGLDLDAVPGGAVEGAGTLVGAVRCSATPPRARPRRPHARGRRRARPAAGGLDTVLRCPGAAPAPALGLVTSDPAVPSPPVRLHAHGEGCARAAAIGIRAGPGHPRSPSEDPNRQSGSPRLWSHVGSPTRAGHFALPALERSCTRQDRAHASKANEFEAPA